MLLIALFSGGAVSIAVAAHFLHTGGRADAQVACEDRYAAISAIRRVASCDRSCAGPGLQGSGRRRF